MSNEFYLVSALWIASFLGWGIAVYLLIRLKRLFAQMRAELVDTFQDQAEALLARPDLSDNGLALLHYLVRTFGTTESLSMALSVVKDLRARQQAGLALSPMNEEERAFAPLIATWFKTASLKEIVRGFRLNSQLMLIPQDLQSKGEFRGVAIGHVTTAA